MRLTTFTDYSLRILLFAAANKDRLVTIAEIQETYQISRGHLMKIVNLLSTNEYLESTRGRSGGIQLKRSPEDINIGEIVRLTEPDFKLTECFGENNKCLISRHCKLPGPLNEALRAFLSVLDGYTLADLQLPKNRFDEVPKQNQDARGPILEMA